MKRERRRSLSRRKRMQILVRDGFTCRYCGYKGTAEEMEADHIIPVAAGGPDAPDNLTAACRACNRAKSDHIVDIPQGESFVSFSYFSRLYKEHVLQEEWRRKLMTMTKRARMTA